MPFVAPPPKIRQGFALRGKFATLTNFRGVAFLWHGEKGNKQKQAAIFRLRLGVWVVHIPFQQQ